ncbi:TPA: hypothetical protein PEV16_001605 [Staphylococcus aureus]|nr:hypothetical protein [Staphylococcus aureus]HDF6768912.1 hypothetical protein [Staphylococcus aureus]
MQVGVGPNIENFEKKFYRQCKLAGPQHREIGFLISTDNASWRAPTQRNWIPNFYRQCKLAGPQHREIGFPISTDNASWGGTTIKKYFFY